ncbi:MAG: ABC transporter ATP-binding protein [Chloroflexi bacterium]|nr:ABC transporter ATP-binding protein [Chloroflexota bacterium]
MTAFVQIQGLRKKYDNNGPFAVGPNEDGLNLEIKEGEIFSLLGPNGAGKTTTISMMSTLLTPTSGEVTIGGYSVTRDPLGAKKQIGVVPQEIALYPTLTARQNLHFFGKMYGLGGRELQSRTAEVLDFIGLKDRADDRVEEYSGGMKRRVNIGVGLMHRPRLIFLDEPTVGIDPQSRRSILDTVKLLNQEGMTVLYTTHYMEEAEELSHRIGIIDHGEIIALGTLEELTRKVGEQDSVLFDVDQVPDGVESQLSALEGVQQTIVQEAEIQVMCTDSNAILSQAIDILTRNGVTLHSVEVQEPDLEAVFLHLTGRALRD